MMIAKVIDKMISTRKHEGLQGIKLLAVESCTDGSILAVGDVLGAGIGEYVLVSLGDPAVLVAEKTLPADAMIVGIIDQKPGFI